MRRFFLVMLVLLLAAAGAWWLGKAPLPAVQGIGALTLLAGIGAALTYLPRAGRRGLSLVYVFVLLAAVTGGLGYFQFYFKPQMIKDIISKSPRPASVVAVTEAKSLRWAPQLPAIGTFRAVLGIDIAPQIGGVIRAVRFESGQDVKKDDLLVEIDDLVEQADLKSNLATLKNLDLALDRQRQLISGGSTARATLDAAQAQRDTAAAAMDRTRALIAQKSLKAPFAGRVGLRKVDTGQYVSPGTAIVTLQQLDPIFVDFPVPEQSFSVMSIGQSVEILVDAWPDLKFTGKVSSIDARIDPSTRNVLVRAEVKNSGGRLRPGMFANLTIASGPPRDVVTLPRTAIAYSLYGDSVYLVKPAPSPAAASGAAQSASGAAQAAPGANPAAPGGETGIVERRPVKTLETRGEDVAVEGVKAGERIISEGQVKLQPGQSVRVNNSAALPPPAAPRPEQ